jgi:hypothetical protein
MGIHTSLASMAVVDAVRAGGILTSEEKTIEVFVVDFLWALGRLRKLASHLPK